MSPPRLWTVSFDHLAGLLVDKQFRIPRAAIVPFEVVQAKATFVHHTTAHRFLLRDEIWAAPGVRDVTEDFRVQPRRFRPDRG
jgi:hypothetical protein